MRNETRVLFNAYLAQIAQLNGVEDASVKFTTAPTVQQTLETKIQESSDFLSRVNMIGVRDLIGEKVGLGVGSTIASNTDTSGSAERQTTDPTTLSDRQYQCRKNNFDTHLTYAKLDAWSKFPDFQTRIRDVILKRMALDRMTIGFNGTSYAADSDRATNPLLQDVNIGWLQQYRANAAERVMDGGATPGTLKVYAGGDYENMDALVFDAVSSLLDPWYQSDPDLVVILGRNLMKDKYFPIVNQNQPATETLASDIIISQKRIGQLPAVTVPYFPENSMMITSYDNLSIYWQEGGRRRHVKEKPERDRIENYESSNDAYEIEDYGKGCLIENIDTNPAA